MSTTEPTQAQEPFPAEPAPPPTLADVRAKVWAALQVEPSHSTIGRLREILALLDQLVPPEPSGG
jgi:hypothetical protein